jgi:hypothetical protein
VLKSLISLFLLTTICISASGQSSKFQKLLENEDYKWAQITLLDSTLKQGLIRDKSEIQRNLRIVFYDSLANKWVYKPEDLISFRLKSARFSADVKSNKFYELVEGGPRLSLFKINSKPTYTTSPGLERSSNGVKLTESSVYEDLGEIYFYYLKSTDVYLKIPRQNDFHEKISEFLKDCPDLSEQILNKEFGSNEFRAIMNLYNFRCEF